MRWGDSPSGSTGSLSLLDSRPIPPCVEGGIVSSVSRCVMYSTAFSSDPWDTSTAYGMISVRSPSLLIRDGMSRVSRNLLAELLWKPHRFQFSDCFFRRFLH